MRCGSVRSLVVNSHGDQFPCLRYPVVSGDECDKPYSVVRADYFIMKHASGRVVSRRRLCGRHE